MKTAFTSALAGLAMLASAQAGNISGTVHAEGKPAAAEEATGGSYDSRKFKFAERVNYAELHDFVVFIEGPVGGKPVAPDKPLVVETRRSVSQRGATFVPHVLPVVVGTTVEWPNNDEIFHNVFSVSEANPFDLDLYKAPVVKKSPPFNKVGRVDVFCSIHSKMNCIVLVLENPYFATADASGHYAITNVPAGTYKLKAWHERLPTQEKEITVAEQGEVKADFVLGIKNLPKF